MELRPGKEQEKLEKYEEEQEVPEKIGRICPQLGAPLTSGLICYVITTGINIWEEVRSVQDHKAAGFGDRKGGRRGTAWGAAGNRQARGGAGHGLIVGSHSDPRKTGFGHM